MKEGSAWQSPLFIIVQENSLNFLYEKTPADARTAHEMDAQLAGFDFNEETYMKKGQILEGIVEKTEYPCKGIVRITDDATAEDGSRREAVTRVCVKNVLPGQKIRFRLTKKRKGSGEGTLLEVLEQSPDEIRSDCPHFGVCGSCVYRCLPYEKQLSLKAAQVKELLESVCKDPHFEGIKASPKIEGYRNKMEFSFGDAYKDGPLSLGMHKRGSFYDIVTVENCRIIDEDYRKILSAVLKFTADAKLPYFHRSRHDGYLRHLLVRKAAATGEILVDLVTTSRDPGMPELREGLVSLLLGLQLEGHIIGILHTVNDSVADTVANDRTETWYGKEWFHEKLLGLTFKITPFSFFQTNSAGAALLYETAREYIGNTADKVIFDLYSGTGTIAQVLAPVARHVTGVEIVKEAVLAAEENAKMNGLSNCTFIAGDVLQVVGSLQQNPDLIILDPPRDGIHPKALSQIIRFGVERMVYISCKPTSLIRDLVMLQENGYHVERSCCVDLFPGTAHIETIVLLQKLNS